MEKLELAQEKRPQLIRSMPPLSALEERLVELRELAIAYRAIHRLCAEVIGTLTIPGNQEAFASLPDEWHEAVAGWVERYKELNERVQC